MSKIYTIGYEGSSIDNLIATLTAVGVECLADVRELPLSRKKGLSKNSLAERLSASNIEYRHFRQLGDPKAGRLAARAKDYSKFEAIYLAHLSSPAGQQSLAELLKVAEIKVTCMLCFERCAHVCHRSYIADQAAMYGFDVFNLVADRPDEYLSNEAKIPRYNPRKSFTAAE
ncbi:DUF488 domain-containing protein [uncultured Tateyamaria sp.]|uniref:DUF488 domain-containing protein n=1 Tax=uncultured Tateyamaria sp. TaxID=455651 RepID=UPI002606BF66|nr:DUF488 domain-containing protein [uncultured Tateyamaria sp.]